MNTYTSNSRELSILSSVISQSLISLPSWLYPRRPQPHRIISIKYSNFLYFPDTTPFKHRMPAFPYRRYWNKIKSLKHNM